MLIRSRPFDTVGNIGHGTTTRLHGGRVFVIPFASASLEDARAQFVKHEPRHTVSLLDAFIRVSLEGSFRCASPVNASPAMQVIDISSDSDEHA